MTLLKQEIPVSSRVGDAALKSFTEVHLRAIVQIGVEVERGERIGWMEASEAMKSAYEWRGAVVELQRIQQTRRNSI